MCGIVENAVGAFHLLCEDFIFLAYLVVEFLRLTALDDRFLITVMWEDLQGDGGILQDEVNHTNGLSFVGGYGDPQVGSINSAVEGEGAILDDGRVGGCQLKESCHDGKVDGVAVDGTLSGTGDMIM